MPLELNFVTEEGSHIGLWRMDETVEELKGFEINQKSGLQGAGPSHLLRQRQQISTLILLDRLSAGPIEFTKDPAGRPWPANKAGFLSISHNREYVAVVYNSLRPCGIDLEQPTERILNIANRFVHPAEKEQIRATHVVQDTTLIWCIKECMYKQIGRRGVGFRDELRVILPKDPDYSQSHGKAFDLHRNPPLMINYTCLRLDNLILVHTIA